jgi:hypothetical protein
MRWPWQRPRLEGVNYLDLVPVRLVDSEPGSEPARLLLRMPRYRDPILGRLLQPRLRGDRRFIRVPLDPRGSWLWPRIDGRRTVGELVGMFRREFPEDEAEIEERLSLYIAGLAAHGFLAVEQRARAAEAGC